MGEVIGVFIALAGMVGGYWAGATLLDAWRRFREGDVPSRKSWCERSRDLF